ncbi:hypothetical protein B23_2252 [Geobacillus thermoleovorans B23]|nr:hypothetical protein B23_2252 [Geobacillus thermoleovorans B23]
MSTKLKKVIQKGVQFAYEMDSLLFLDISMFYLIYDH